MAAYRRVYDQWRSNGVDRVDKVQGVPSAGAAEFWEKLEE